MGLAGATAGAHFSFQYNFGDFVAARDLRGKLERGKGKSYPAKCCAREFAMAATSGSCELGSGMGGPGAHPAVQSPLESTPRKAAGVLGGSRALAAAIEVFTPPAAANSNAASNLGGAGAAAASEGLEPKVLEYGETKGPVELQCQLPSCNRVHDGTYGSGRFCGKKCARSYSAKCYHGSRARASKATEARKSVRSPGPGPQASYVCQICGKECPSSQSLAGHTNACRRRNTNSRSRTQLTLLLKKHRSDYQYWNPKRLMHEPL